MEWNLKRDADPSDVVGVGEKEGQMAVKPAATGTRDRTSVSKQPIGVAIIAT